MEPVDHSNTYINTYILTKEIKHETLHTKLTQFEFKLCDMNFLYRMLTYVLIDTIKMVKKGKA